MDTKWKRSRAVCGFLAFVVGLSLVLEGLLFFGANLCAKSGRQWMADSFEEDWRNTQEFRNFVSTRLEVLITMGAGGIMNGYGSYYAGGYGWGRETGDGTYQARYLHNRMSKDKNVLYYVAAEGEVKYTNDESLAGMTPTSRLDSYGFFLRFDGEKVRIWVDGEELDIYGDGVYDGDQERWYVPGYRNFNLGEDMAKVEVTMAVINKPYILVEKNYGTRQEEQYGPLYSLEQNLLEFRQSALSRLGRLGLGAALLVVYILLRRDKARADRFLARGTGKVWFEGKLVLFLALLVCFLPRTGYLTEVWRELSCAYGSSEAATITEWGEIIYDSGVTQVAGNAGWMLRAYLSELAQYPGRLLVIFWGFYLLIVNDWRYNKKPWRHGLCSLLAARELKYPLQKRLSRMGGILAVALLLMWGEVLFFQVAQTLALYLPPWAIWNLFSLPWLLSLGIWAWTFRRQRKLWTDFGAVADQAAAIRAGALERELTLQEGADLYQLADDLNHIRQGLHQAVEERTCSERMKVELVTNVSHDLKTPLTSIISYTELLAQEPLEPPASEYVKILGEKSQRLRAMVQDVFEVSKAASGQLPVRLERLDYARLLRQTLADMDGAIRDSSLALRASIPEEKVPITADSDRLYRVFQNLIGNALKYSLPGSRIYISLEVEGEQASARIKNTSAVELKPGADYTARFVRGDESRTDGGSGLGLSIADSFTRACGGTLSVVTEADLFSVCVTFPLWAEDKA